VQRLAWLVLLSASAHAIEDASVEAANDAQVEDTLSKKAEFLAEKASRPKRHAHKPLEARAQPAVTVMNVWTHEVLPVNLKQPMDRQSFNQLTRCHFTNQASQMDRRLPDIVMRAARKFAAKTVELVSGFRAPKYQLMLRKKGREVARDSQHPRGTAVDFRLPQVPIKRLLKFVKSLRMGGVGYYPHSQFVHADVGRIRFWRGN
jgi:hypothetical protein